MSCGSKAAATSSMGGRTPTLAPPLRARQPWARRDPRARVDVDRSGLLRRVALTQREALVTRTPPDPDVIPVRPGEEIDAAAVGAYVAGRLPGASGAPEIWQFPGGHANLTYLLHYPGGPNYVLRRPPPGDLPASAHDMGREYRVLSVLYQAFPPAPRAFLYCEDTSVIGRPFFVMERRRGTVVRREVPPEFGGGKDLVANRKLSEVIIDTLAA